MIGNRLRRHSLQPTSTASQMTAPTSPLRRPAGPPAIGTPEHSASFFAPGGMFGPPIGRVPPPPLNGNEPFGSSGAMQGAFLEGGLLGPPVSRNQRTYQGSLPPMQPQSGVYAAGAAPVPGPGPLSPSATQPAGVLRRNGGGPMMFPHASSVGGTPEQFDRLDRQSGALSGLSDQLAGIQRDAQAVVDGQKSPQEKMAEFEARQAMQNQAGRLNAYRKTYYGGGYPAGGGSPVAEYAPMGGQVRQVGMNPGLPLGAEPSANQTAMYNAAMSGQVPADMPMGQEVFARGQMRQPGGTYDPGYGQVQGGGAPGVRPGGYGLYGQGSYQNLPSPAATEPKNEYGLRRNPTPVGAGREVGDANMSLDPKLMKPGAMGTYGDGRTQVYRTKSGGHRLVGTPEDPAKRAERIAKGAEKRKSFLADRANTIAERKARRLGLPMPKAGESALARPAGPDAGTTIPLPSKSSGSVVADGQIAATERDESLSALDQAHKGKVLDPIAKATGMRQGVRFDAYNADEIAQSLDNPKFWTLGEKDRDVFRSSVGHYLRVHPRDSFTSPELYDHFLSFAEGKEDYKTWNQRRRAYGRKK